MNPLMKVVRTAYTEKVNWKKACYEFLLSYRVTPHSSTNISPADVMFGRKINHPIPQWNNKVNSDVTKTLNINDKKGKEISKKYADLRNKSKLRDIKIGDTVLVKQESRII